MSDRNILFSGLPESGKTTYLAALWYYVFNSFGDQKYTVADMEGCELEYLHGLSENWALCNPVSRTSLNKPEQVVIKIKETDTNNVLTLNIPDISGETFKSQFELREWQKDFEDIINKSSGLLLFVDPRDNMNKPRFILEETRSFKIFGEELPEGKEQPSSWTEELVPSQVKIVDFLQMLDYHKPNQIQKIAVIVSCWDLIKQTETPEKWCKDNLPLLSQFLESNNQSFTAKYFGVSPQGGDYEKSKESLLEKDAITRIIVTDGNEMSNNILYPILWIINND